VNDGSGPHSPGVLRALRPPLVLVENVPGLLLRGAGDVLGDLAASGYDAEWDCIPAAAVGAPHLRDRVWLVAYSNRHEWSAGCVVSDAWTNWRDDAARSGAGVADADGARCDGRAREQQSLCGSSPPTAADSVKWWPTPTAADADRRSATYFRGNPTLLGAVELWPTPTARDSRSFKGAQHMAGWTGADSLAETGATVEQTRSGALNPTWVEWLMGFPLGWTDCGPSATPSSRKSRSGSAGGSGRLRKPRTPKTP
jgi:site-specific DNA-cytosine methylase